MYKELSINQACKPSWRPTRNTLSGWIKSGKFKNFRIRGQAILVDVYALDAFVAMNKLKKTEIKSVIMNSIVFAPESSRKIIDCLIKKSKEVL